jgi:hypothetical protein
VEDDMNTDTPTESPTESLTESRRRIQPPLWTVITLAVLLAAALLWRQFSVAALERRMDEQRQTLLQQAGAERSAQAERARSALARQDEELQELFGTALSWAVRSALLRKNMDEIDQYIGQLIEYRRFSLVLLADAGGKVLLASDRKYHNQSLQQHFPSVPLDATGVRILGGQGARVERQLVLPVQGLTTRLGTLLLIYTPTYDQPDA